MKKYIAGLLLLLAGAVAAQTFPVQNINVLGQLQFSGSPGTAGYIPQSNGTSPPTWVAPSTIFPAFPIGIANGGTGATIATGGVNNLQYLQGATGSVAESLQAKFQQTVDIADFGALCNGSHDDTAAIQAAINTGSRVHLDTGTCIVTNTLTVATPGQTIYGDGRARTIIQVPATFNLSALGVFVATGGEPGPIFADFKVFFVQPDTTVRANLVAYPPAFYMRGTPRFQMFNLRISEAITGIDCAGGTNCGGALMENIEMQAYTLGITFDGSVDTVRIDKWHFWPFDLTTNQQIIFYDGTVGGLLAGRIDDLKMTDSLTLASGYGMKFAQTASGVTSGSIKGVSFDTYGGLIVQAGNLTIGTTTWSVATANKQAILQTGGFVRISGGDFTSSIATTAPLVQATGTAGPILEIDNSFFRPTGDMQVVNVSSSSGESTMNLMNNQFITQLNSSPVNAIITATSGTRLTAIGNRCLDKGTGTGNFINITTDDFHNIIGNTGVGWTYAHPAFTNGVFANNN